MEDREGFIGYYPPPDKKANWLTTDAEYFGTTDRADPLSSWSPVFQGNLLGVLNLPLRPAFETECFHPLTSFNYIYSNSLEL